MSEWQTPPPVIEEVSHLMAVLLDVAAERVRQDAKWGADRNLPSGTWGLILTEEVGEAARAALELSADATLADHAFLRGELVQVAAVAVAWIEAIDGGRA